MIFQEILSGSTQETVKLGKQLGATLSANSVLCFFGDLAAGKTAFIKGVASSVSQLPEEEVTSPTYVYLNQYEGPLTVYHFDLYRLQDQDEFVAMGFAELFSAGGVCCIEWAERIESILPKDAYYISLEHHGEGSRRICIKKEL